VSPWLITTTTSPAVAALLARAMVGHPVTAATGAVVLVLGAAIAAVGHRWGRRSAS